MSQYSKRNIFLLIGLLAISLFVLLYYIFDPALSKFFPPCPFHYMTGYDCPGCGSQRALHHLLHLDILKAFQQNALFVLSLPYIAFGLYLEYLGEKSRFPRLSRLLFGRKVILLILILVVLFWIGRNML